MRRSAVRSLSPVHRKPMGNKATVPFRAFPQIGPAGSSPPFPCLPSYRQRAEPSLLLFPFGRGMALPGFPLFLPPPENTETRKRLMHLLVSVYDFACLFSLLVPEQGACCPHHSQSYAHTFEDGHSTSHKLAHAVPLPAYPCHGRYQGARVGGYQGLRGGYLLPQHTLLLADRPQYIGAC